MDINRLRILLQKQKDNHLNEQEESELLSWYEGLDLEGVESLIWKDPETKDELTDVYLEELMKFGDNNGSKRGMFSFWYAKVGMVASLLLCLGYGIYHFAAHNTPKRMHTANVISDANPGGNHAMLRLGDGSSVFLDTLSNRGVLNKNGVLKLSDDIVAFKESKLASGNNVVSTPRGGTFQIQLPDGSKVWLNAASSLKFPTHFKNALRREVTLTGEAFFDVVHNSKQPFLIHVGDQKIYDIGTSFNVCSYPNENTKTTVVSGAVSVEKDKIAYLLKPGMQSIGNDKSPDLKINQVDVNDYIGWKNGIMDLDNKSFLEIMNEISRWYDVDVVYDGPIPDVELAGKMDRGLQLSELLDGFNMMHIKYTIINKKLIIKSK